MVITAAEASKRDDLERQLASEGLAPISDSEASRRIFGGNGTEGARHADESAAAVSAYTEWAARVLETHGFSSERQKGMWALHAEGASMREIAVAFDVMPGAVWQAINVVTAKAGPPPVENPWRKGGGHRPNAAKELRKIMKGEMEKQARRPVKYSRIMFIGTVNVPGKPHRHDMVKDVEGVPHAGGIDLTFQVEVGNAGEKEPRRITVPWTNIKQADHANDV